ncbi:MAG TPA: sulfotransferase [Stellaceae bacterium]|nr:sulfotransferase [Stellaceae bacterium]
MKDKRKLKVFVVSLHRCGTQSTDQFLSEMGLRTCHFPSQVDGVSYEMKCLGWETTPAKITEFLRPVFESFDAVSDVPVPAIYEELDAAYQNARFIAVCRNPAEWLRSVRRHTRSRNLCIYERAQYWRYLPNKPLRLETVSDDALLQMYETHYSGLVAYFAGRQNFLLADLTDPSIAVKVSSFLEISSTNAIGFPRVDYKMPNTSSSRFRFHVLGVPHTISKPEYNMDAFTQKVVRLCAMLKRRGHYVIHYGHEDSQVECDDHVTVLRKCDLSKAYGEHNWRKDGIPDYRIDDHVYQTFYAQSIAAIEQRKQKFDFLLCMAGGNHQVVGDAHKDMIVCEPGIGYPNGYFAPFKVFESYALLHAYLGLPAVGSMRNDMWYNAVIPNYFDLSEFEFSAKKEDYFLFLGRVNPGKGFHIAIQTVEAVGGKLIVAGPGSIEGVGTRTARLISEYVQQVGAVDVHARKRLLANAKAVILPSMFVEPFCGVQIESMLSGTPIITSDWGAFAEYNLHGVTGYRCRTFDHFVWAAENIGNIFPERCREWASENFSMERVGEMYDEYFFSVKNIFNGAGWYQEYPGRTQLDWLKRHWPTPHF